MAEGNKLGEWSFIIGVAIAIIVGLFSGSLSKEWYGWAILLLVVLGLVVGLLNITEHETTPFLVAAIALLATGNASVVLEIIPKIGVYLAGIVNAIAVFVAPGAIVVALKAIKSLAKD
ncbi:hypothetical protein HYU10_00140 [Candidatus Woesearchaeota archaeon]|nr:hypothetical protein [Candidatus Woesearchaeota archaeon]MBI2130159.1 hypothetical protein [Candidatus Woesearchaeota archaeon]MBI2661312.1 hypothetical protein [Candidatus Woesearchaeota archaeon]